MDEWDLTDAWRYRNPSRRQFTFHRGQQASRIDYWLISNHLADICLDSDITHLALSDHSLLTLSVGNKEPRRGPGLWRMDNSLLADEKYIEEISDLLESLIRESEDSDPSAKWEWMKFRIREKSMELEAKTRRQQRKEEKELNKTLAALIEDKDKGQDISEEEIASVKRELQELELARAQKNIFRARANYARYREKSSSYFLNLEKRKAKGRTISTLITDEGILLSDTKEILEYERSFYERLYEQEEDVPEIPINPPCSDSRRLRNFQGLDWSGRLRRRNFVMPSRR